MCYIIHPDLQHDTESCSTSVRLLIFHTAVVVVSHIFIFTCPRIMKANFVCRVDDNLGVQSGRVKWHNEEKTIQWRSTADLWVKADLITWTFFPALSWMRQSIPFLSLFNEYEAGGTTGAGKPGFLWWSRWAFNTDSSKLRLKSG